MVEVQWKAVHVSRSKAFFLGKEPSEVHVEKQNGVSKIHLSLSIIAAREIEFEMPGLVGLCQ